MQRGCHRKDFLWRTDVRRDERRLRHVLEQPPSRRARGGLAASVSGTAGSPDRRGSARVIYRPPYVGGDWRRVGSGHRRSVDGAHRSRMADRHEQRKETNQDVSPAQIERRLTRNMTPRRVSKSPRRIHCPCHRGRLDCDRQRRRKRVERLGIDHVAARITEEG